MVNSREPPVSGYIGGRAEVEPGVVRTASRTSERG